MIHLIKNKILLVMLVCFCFFIFAWVIYNFIFTSKIFDFNTKVINDDFFVIQIDREKYSDSQIAGVLASSSLFYKDDRFLRFKVQDDSLTKLKNANIDFVLFPGLNQNSDDRAFLVTIKDPLTDSKTQVLANYGSIIFNYPLKRNSFLMWGDKDLGERISKQVQIVEYSSDLRAYERLAPDVFFADLSADVSFNIKYLLTKSLESDKLNRLEKSGLKFVGRFNTRFINEQYDVLDIQVRGTYQNLLDTMRDNPEIFYVYSASN